MSIIKKIFLLFADNGKTHRARQTGAASACSRHPERQIFGVCRYCERTLCSDCLTLKNDFFSCSDKTDCLQHIQQPDMSKADRVRKIFSEFAERPNAMIVNHLMNLVLEAKDPEITDAILDALDFKSTNLGVYGLAIHCLGFVRDPRALDRLTHCFTTLSNLDTLPPDPRLQTICADHLQRSAEAILQRASRVGFCDGRLCAVIKKIAESSALPPDIKEQAAVVLLEKAGSPI
jgi:hypothetical protein